MIKRNEMIERLLSAEKYPLDGSFNDNLSELLIDGEGIVYPFSFIFCIYGYKDQNKYQTYCCLYSRYITYITKIKER